jgi:hypothetical protein
MPAEARRQAGVGAPALPARRWLLAAAAVLGLALPVAFAQRASAQPAFSVLDAVGFHIDNALREEREAMGHTAKKAHPHLRESIGSLIDAEEDVEEAFDIGEISRAEEGTLLGLLKSAIAEDRKAEEPDLTVVERDKRIKGAIAIKEDVLNEIADAEHVLFVSPFGTVTAPPAPPQIKFGSALLGTPGPLLGDFSADVEFWDSFYAALNGVGGVVPQDTAPANGWLAGVWVKGYAVSGDMPGPGGSEPFRVGVEQPLPNGQLKVLSTSNPPYTLPGTNGSYYYWVGPPYTQFPMPLTKGDYLSFDTRGGTWAIFSSQAGSTVNSSSGSGLEQNPGVVWSPTAHANVELDAQWIEEPAVSITKLSEATKRVQEAMGEEKAASKASKRGAKGKLKHALVTIALASKLINEAGTEGEVSEQTELVLNHLVSIIEADDQEAARSKPRGRKGPKRFLFGAIADKAKLLQDLEAAISLAKKTP